jgi:two-component system CheB/CheR fusion protein
VLAGRGPVERRVAHEDRYAHYLVRIRPYRNVDQRTEGVVVAFVDITVVTRVEARQRVLITELQHRTRNLLTIVQSISSQTLGRHEAVEAFSARLAALGRVQSLISNSRTGEIEMAEVIRLELQAHGADNDPKVTVGGPPATLSVEQVQTFALALHELATNALKYGALRQAAGRLDVAWVVTPGEPDGPWLTLNWRESGVAMPPDLTRKGYGTRLIERALRFTLRARTELVFGDDGVSCRIELPLNPSNATNAPDEA